MLLCSPGCSPPPEQGGQRVAKAVLCFSAKVRWGPLPKPWPGDISLRKSTRQVVEVQTVPPPKTSPPSYRIPIPSQQTKSAQIRILIARAIAALARFDIIGDLSQPQVFAKQLRRQIGTPLPLWRRNAAPVPTEIPSNLRPQIEALCAANITVYHAVQTNRIAA